MAGDDHGVVKEDVHDGEQLAAYANALLGTYQSNGRILITDSKPITVERPAEHLIVAMLGKRGLIETVFARMVLVDGTRACAEGHWICPPDGLTPATPFSPQQDDVRKAMSTAGYKADLVSDRNLPWSLFAVLDSRVRRP